LRIEFNAPTQILGLRGGFETTYSRLASKDTLIQILQGEEANGKNKNVWQDVFVRVRIFHATARYGVRPESSCRNRAN
jgi:hypothetical protein